MVRIDKKLQTLEWGKDYRNYIQFATFIKGFWSFGIDWENDSYGKDLSINLIKIKVFIGRVVEGE